MTRNKQQECIGVSACLRLMPIALCLWLLSVPVSAAESSVSITVDQWARVQSAADFMAIPGLKALVDSTVDDQSISRRVLEIHYAGGENGQLWAQQVRNRLVGLGLDSSRIEMMQGGAATDQVQINARESR